MRNVRHAFAHCVERYAQCPVYKLLSGEGRYEAPKLPLLVAG